MRTVNDFDSTLQQVHQIGREALAPYADAVDRDARFPHEAFAAIRQAGLLGAYVPSQQGGQGLDIGQIARICEALGRYCASSAMIYAMHQIQVACIVHHALESPFFREYAESIAAQQLLLASATTEVGTGGDLRSSICALNVDGRRFTVEKQAPVVSYAEQADAILLTCRSAPTAASSDQAHVLLRRGDYALQPMCDWDTLGFRGTCSAGYTIRGSAPVEQILPRPYAEIHAKTMHPVAHITWGSLWTGLAADALNRARTVVRAQARKSIGVTPLAATRLAEADSILHAMRASLAYLTTEYSGLLGSAPLDAFTEFGFNIRVNNVKLNSSRLLIDVVSRAMQIAGIEAYRNDSRLSLGRHIRDAYGTALMVSNDRVLSANAKMQIAYDDA